MRKTIIAGVAATALAAMTGVAVAQTAAPAPRAGPERPHRLPGDADRDGRLTQAEFVDGRVARLTAMDADGDGTVTREEMRAAFEAKREPGPVVIAEARAKLMERFAVLDADHDGVATAQEMRAARASARPDDGEARRERREHRRMQQPASPAPASE